MSSVTCNKEDQDKKTNIVLLLDFKVFKYSDIHDCSPFRDVCEYMFEYFGYRSVSRRLLALFRPVYTEHASVMFFFVTQSHCSFVLTSVSIHTACIRDV